MAWPNCKNIVSGNIDGNYPQTGRSGRTLHSSHQPGSIEQKQRRNGDPFTSRVASRAEGPTYTSLGQRPRGRFPMKDEG